MTRSPYLDISKGIAILCVVLGHCIQFGSGKHYFSEGIFFENHLFLLIYSFHMPLFMLISGYLLGFSLSRQSPWEEIKKRTRTLLLPVFSWGVVSLVLFVSFGGEFSPKPIAGAGPLRRFLYQIVGGEYVLAVEVILKYVKTVFSSLWFLWALFICSLVVIVNRSLLKDNLWFYFATLIIAFLTPDFLFLSLIKWVYPFFLLGYWVNVFWGRSFLLVCKRYIRVILVFSFILFGILFSFFKSSYLVYLSGFSCIGKNVLDQLWVDTYRFFIGLVGCECVLSSLYVLLNVLPIWFNRVLQFVGKKAMGIYVFSEFIFGFFLLRITGGLSGINYGITFCEMICILVITLILTILFQQSRVLNFLFLGGRPVISSDLFKRNGNVH